MDVDDVEAGRLEVAHEFFGKLASLVGRVIEKLHVEEFAGVFELGDGFEQPLDDVKFVEDRKLHGDARQLLELAAWLGDVLSIL